MTHPTLPTTSELARLIPAEVTTRSIQRHRAPARRPLPADQRVETLVGTHEALNRELRMLARNRGRLLGAGERHLILSGEHAGLLEQRVIIRDEKRAPRWTKICIALGSVLVGLAAVFGALIYALSQLDFKALAVFAAVLLVVLLAMIKAGGDGRARGVFVQVTTSVHVR